MGEEGGTLAWMNERYAKLSGAKLGDPIPNGPLEGNEVEETRSSMGGGAVLIRWRIKGGQGGASGLDRQARFLTLMSHDVRGMLANVRSYASLMLLGKTPLEEKTRRSVEVIARNADRAIATLQEFFDLARAEMGMLMSDASRRPLNALVGDVVGAAKKAGADPSVAVTFEAPAVEITVDTDRFTQACKAFLVHAIARAGQGGEVTMVGSYADGVVQIEVKDSGPSMSTEEAARAFDVRGRALADHKLGPGFALGVAAAILTAQGGKAWVAPSGSAFGFSLPG